MAVTKLAESRVSIGFTLRTHVNTLVTKSTVAAIRVPISERLKEYKLIFNELASRLPIGVRIAAVRLYSEFAFHLPFTRIYSFLHSLSASIEMEETLIHTAFPLAVPRTAFSPPFSGTEQTTLHRQ